MLLIDGSHGEGGGQIVRSSLALSLVTGQAVTIENLRARRRRPGLMRQHLVAVRAAQQISGARVEGDVLGSRRLVFEPQQVRPGEYRFAIGSAGSTMLVLQTVLPALMIAEAGSVLVLEGGTHNPLAPPFEFLEAAYVPLLARLGPRVQMQLERPGFYPAGGGRVTVRISPAGQLGRLELIERGEVQRQRVRAVVARLPRHIAERECRTIADLSGWPEDRFEVHEVADSAGPGNAVLIEVAARQVTEVFTGVGEKGVRAETVAERTWRDAARYLESGVPVGHCLADQLLLPLGIGAWQGTGGGIFRTLELTEHATTHIQVLQQFLDIAIDVDRGGPDDVQVQVNPPAAQ